ncbi:MAG: carboxypeptidase-like regulatory domain-containing protein [bacterium]
MHERKLLFAALFVTMVSFCALWGCGGGSSSSTTDSGSNSQHEDAYTGYVYAPVSSGQSLFRLYNLTDTSTEEGVLVLDSPAQAPAGYEPLVGCKVVLPDGTEATTDAYGRFGFARIPFTSSDRGMPLIIDPQGSNHPRLAQVIVPLVVPRRGTAADLVDSEDLRLVVRPASLLLSKGSRFLYHAFWVDDSQGAVYQVLPDDVTWSVGGEGGRIIGTISSGGLFLATGLGKGQVVATARVNSRQMTASSEIEVIDRLQVSRIYGLVTDAFQNPVEGVIIFVAGFENGVVTGCQGDYLIPRVPTGESLTLTFIYRGIVVRTLKDVVLEHGEAKEINVSLDTFHETGRLFFRGGQVILSVEGLAGPLSTDEFPQTKEYELLGVAEVYPDIYQQLQQDPSVGIPAIVEGTPNYSSSQVGSLLPQVHLTSLQVLAIEQNAPVETLQGEISWQNGEAYFRGTGRGQNSGSGQLKVDGLGVFSRIQAKIQNSPGTWFAVKVIGRIDRLSRIITLLNISMVEKFFQEEGEIYYNPDISPQGAILMEPAAAGSGQTEGQQPYLLLNVRAVSPEICDLLTSFPNKRFSGQVSGFELDESGSDFLPVSVSRIQLFSEAGYLLHKRGKIWSDTTGQIRFSPSLSLGAGEEVYILNGVSEFDEIQATLEQFPGRVYLCYLSGEISQGGDEITVSQLELLGPDEEPQGDGAGLRGDGIAYYKIDNGAVQGYRYLYQKIMSNGYIDGNLYELSNIRPGSEIADTLKAQPGQIFQVTLNYSDIPNNGQQNNVRPGPTRLIVNKIDIVKNGDPLFQVSGELIYHSWENILEMVATSPAFPAGSRQSFILDKVPNGILSDLMSHPDRFISVTGIIQVFQQGQRSIRDPLKAKALNLEIEEDLD